MDISIGPVHLHLEVPEHIEKKIYTLMEYLEIPKKGSTEIPHNGKSVPISPQSKQKPSRPDVAPQWAPMDNELVTLARAGISLHTYVLIVNNVLGFNVSKREPEVQLDEVIQSSLAWLDRPLKEPYWGLVVGPCYQPAEASPGIVVIGINEKNHLSILALGVGDPQHEEVWETTIKALKKRKLSGLKLIITPKIDAAQTVLHRMFLEVKFGLCWPSTIKEVAWRIPSRSRKNFRAMAQEAMYAQSKKETKELIKALHSLGPDVTSAVRILEGHMNELTEYLNYDRRFYRALRTSSAAMKFDRDVRNRGAMAGTDNPELLKLVLAFTALRIEYHWRKFAIDSESLETLPYLQAKMNPVEE